MSTCADAQPMEIAPAAEEDADASTAPAPAFKRGDLVSQRAPHAYRPAALVLRRADRPKNIDRAEHGSAGAL